MHLDNSILIVLVVVIGFLLLVILRKLYFPSHKTTKDNSRKDANKITRIAESIILLSFGLAIFIFTATNTSTGGRLLILDQFPKGFAVVNIIAAILAFVGILIATGFVYFKKTAIGVVILTIVLSCYGFVLNGHESILESIVPESMKAPGATLTFYLSSPDVQGGELWVNGVHLGTLPYETTYEEFYEKVPYWPEEPNENKLENRDSWLKYPARGDYNVGETSVNLYKPWTRILLPQESDNLDDKINPITGSQRYEEDRTYYVRVKIGDEWGFTNGSSGTHSSGRGQFRSPKVSVSFEFFFPERQEKIEKLLDVARLENYSPDSNWFKAMESYNSDGWIALRKAMDTEPDMLNLLDAWATWKYDLDKVTDSESAWKVFKRIYYEAEEQKYYMTSNIAGRAVELLVKKLDPQFLVKQGLRAIRSKRYFHWIVWEMNGSVQFGISYNSKGLHTGANMITSTSGDDMSPGDFMIAHAIWELDKLLDKKDDTKPNIVENVLVPEFIAKSYDRIDTLKIAAHIGGPKIEKYLLRQNWRAPANELPWKQQTSYHDINGWLYLLANLNTQAGQEFRAINAEIIMDMSDILVKNMRMSRDEDIDYIFLDNRLVEQSLAFKYWPRFKEFIANSGPRDYLKRQFEYLIKMEPISKPEMYVQCWKDFINSNEVHFHEAIGLFEKADIPLQKREQIYSALVEHISKDVSNIISDEGKDRLRDSLISILKNYLFSKSKNEIAVQIFDELQSPSPNSKYKPEKVAAWLATNAKTHPLIKMLAESDEPRLRLLVMVALKEHPIPANRKILEKLLNDSDEQVQKAAEEVMSELKQLRDTELTQLEAK